MKLVILKKRKIIRNEGRESNGVYCCFMHSRVADVMARIAVSRMFMNSEAAGNDPWRVAMVAARGEEIGLSPRVFRQMGEMMAMVNRTVTDKITFRPYLAANDLDRAFEVLSVLWTERCR